MKAHVHTTVAFQNQNLTFPASSHAMTYSVSDTMTEPSRTLQKVCHTDDPIPKSESIQICSDLWRSQNSTETADQLITRFEMVGLNPIRPLNPLFPAFRLLKTYASGLDQDLEFAYQEGNAN